MREIDVDDIIISKESQVERKFMRTYTIKSPQKDKRKETVGLNKTLEVIKKRDSVRGSLNLRKYKRKKSFMALGEGEAENIRENLKKTGFMDIKGDSTEEFFREQLDNELPKAERAKRIDEKLQDFDTNFEVKNLVNSY